MPIPCRACQAALKPLEIKAASSGDLMLRPTRAYEAVIEDDPDFDPSSPVEMGRFLDGYACFACDTVELAVADRKRYLDCEGRYLPQSPHRCPACRSLCRGPLGIECFGIGEPPLAFLDRRYGAPLVATLCPGCGRVWLSLDRVDDEARSELSRRFPSDGPCELCERGQIRVTQIDVPHSGFAGLYRPVPPAEDGRHRHSTHVANLLVAVCDSCGLAEVRLEATGAGGK